MPMKTVYDLVLRLAAKLLAFLTSHPRCMSEQSKFKQFVEGQDNLLDKIEAELAGCTPMTTYWFHASSLGEYGVALPIIRQIKSRQECRVVLTFFSPSGYNVLRDNHKGIDYLFYLPLDTPDNARRFIDLVQPTKAFFIISEYWLNYLHTLYQKNIPTFLISALITAKTPFCRWWGGMYRRAMKAYTHITVLDEPSLHRLHKLGMTSCSIAKDPLFDKAQAIARTPYRNTIVEHFARGRRLFIAGSVSDKNDLQLVASLANSHPDLRMLIVPHDISDEANNEIRAQLRGKVLLYSECDENTDFSQVQALIIDYIGDLAYLYRYATWSYVGGGFTPYLHSLIESTIYGVPVAYGPRIRRKATAL